MTPEQFATLITAVGGSTAFLGCIQLITKLIDVYAGRRVANDGQLERRDGLGQADKERLWKRVEQLESDAKTTGERHERELAALGDRHDRELTEVRTRLDRVTTELIDARAAVALTEQERQHALGLYTALLQAHEKLKVAHDELRVQVTALQVENTEMRRRLPAPGGTT